MAHKLWSLPSFLEDNWALFLALCGIWALLPTMFLSISFPTLGSFPHMCLNVICSMLEKDPLLIFGVRFLCIPFISSTLQILTALFSLNMLSSLQLKDFLGSACVSHQCTLTWKLSQDNHRGPFICLPSLRGHCSSCLVFRIMKIISLLTLFDFIIVSGRRINSLLIIFFLNPEREVFSIFKAT